MSFDLYGRGDLDLPERIARSAAATSSARTSLADCLAWLNRRRAKHPPPVRSIPFSELDGWSFNAATGNLAHRSGRFFSIEGMNIRVEGPETRSWDQPIIVQPEVGILGFLATEFSGTLHFLVQAKMEPGNPRAIQISPTVQATQSNYTGVHQGRVVPYVEYFLEPGHGHVLADVLQSEHGSWFFRKVNRNMVVEIQEGVPVHEDFQWLTLGQIGRLLRLDNTVNMDARTVLSCLPTSSSGTRALMSDTELLSWLVDQRARWRVQTQPIPLLRTRRWSRGTHAIERADGRYFTVRAASVRASGREVEQWSQPLLRPVERGVLAFLVRHFDSVPHLLVQARVEGGLVDGVELGPTVQCAPRNYPPREARNRPPFLDTVLDAPSRRVLYRAVHSEEGGRFDSAENTCLFVSVDDSDVPERTPPGYAWATVDQLNSLVRHGQYVNIQARTLLSVMITGALRL